MAQEVWTFLATRDYDRWYAVNDLIDNLGMPENTIRDQLTRLHKGDQVVRRWDGRRYVFRRKVYNAVGTYEK